MINKSIICAVDENYGFGKDGKIPWHFPEDLAFFKKTTLNSVIVMGKQTYLDSLQYFQDKPYMPGRMCVVVSKTLDNSTLRENVARTDSLNGSTYVAEYFAREENYSNIFFIGGEGIFNNALDFVDHVYMTKIPGNYECDVFLDREKFNKKFVMESERIGDKSKELIFQKYKIKT